MAQVKIVEEGTFFKVVDAVTGLPVLPSYYSTLRGARQAATKSGHTYGAAKAAPKTSASQEAVIAEAIRAALAAHGIVENNPKPAPKKEETPKTWEDSKAFALGYTRERCQEVFDFLLAAHRASGGDWKAGEAALLAAGHTQEGVWSAFRAGKAMRAAARIAAKKEREASAPAPATARKSIPPVVDAGILSASKKEEPAPAPVADAAPKTEGAIDPLSEIRNSLARANGFKRYRSIRRASERGDARATALLAAIRAAIAAHEVTLRGLSPEEVASKNEQFLRVMGA